MIDNYDSETLVKIYRLLSKKCGSIDNYIKNHAYSFGCAGSEFGAEDVCNSIVELMTRKNQLINLKVIVDTAVNSLKEEDKKIIYIKMNYNLTIDEICGILNLKERTAFRRIDRAINSLTNALNSSKYINKLINIMNNEIWIGRIREEVRTHKLAYKTALC